MHTKTHRFTGLWVDHLTLVKVKLALVILWMEIEDTNRKLDLFTDIFFFSLLDNKSLNETFYKEELTRSAALNTTGSKNTDISN